MYTPSHASQGEIVSLVNDWNYEALVADIDSYPQLNLMMDHQRVTYH